jgi:hypothetical protein
VKLRSISVCLEFWFSTLGFLGVFYISYLLLREIAGVVDGANSIAYGCIVDCECSERSVYLHKYAYAFIFFFG